MFNMSKNKNDLAVVYNYTRKSNREPSHKYKVLL